MAAGGLTKTWRNSACLILASGAFKYNTRPLLKTSLQAVNPKSTPVCLQDFQTPDITRAQLEFLMLKRSEASSFMVRAVGRPPPVVPFPHFTAFSSSSSAEQSRVSWRGSRHRGLFTRVDEPLQGVCRGPSLCLRPWPGHPKTYKGTFIRLCTARVHNPRRSSLQDMRH